MLTNKASTCPMTKKRKEEMTHPICSLAFVLFFCVGVCWSYGMEGCSHNYLDRNDIWCSRRNIQNISRVVKLIPRNATNIDLSRNQISILPADVFRKFWRLQRLTLRRNSISFLKRGQFDGLGALNYLNLSSNNLSEISPDAFQGLTQLNGLFLYDNRIAEIPAGFFRFLPQVKTLDLSLNKLRALNSSLCHSRTLSDLDVSSNWISYLNLRGFPSLVSLDVSNNPLLHLIIPGVKPSLKTLMLLGIGPDILAGVLKDSQLSLRKVSFSVSVQSSPNITGCSLLERMPNLGKVKIDLGGSGIPTNTSVLMPCSIPTILYLKNGSLSNMKASQLVKDGRKTTQLTLDGCRLRSISKTTFLSLQRLVNLNIQGTGELDICDDTFSALQRLKTLTLSSVGVRAPKPEWFQNIQHLNELVMSKNQMTELTRNVFAALAKLKKLSLRHNSLQHIANQPFCNLTLLQTLDLSMNSISKIEKGSFECLVNLKNLNLQGNKITTVNPDTFLGLEHLNILTLYNNLLHFNKGDSPFTGLSSLKRLYLSYQGPITIGMGYLGPTLFNGLTHLEILNLGFVTLTTFDPEVFAPVPNLKELFISNIEMTKTNLTALFRHLTSLEDLYLMECDLDFLPDVLLPPQNSLKYLKIQSNHFRVFEKSLHDNLPMLEYLDITGNPVTCSCENAWFKNWSFHSLRVQVPYLYDVHCDNDLREPRFWEFDDKACRSDSIYFNYFVSTAVLDGLFILFGLTWHKYRSSFRYLVLLVRSRVGGRKKGRKQDFAYDAFISYSSHDDPWVMGELVPRMEGPEGMGFRLCLHHRDFRPGAAILENIEAAIYGSRRTLCVVSRDFLRSEWCSLEFQLASLRLLCDRNDVLLLVFLEKIPDYCLSPYTRLRKMVRKNTYLLWPEDSSDREAFWVRLQNALREGTEEKEDEFTRLLG